MIYTVDLTLSFPLSRGERGMPLNSRLSVSRFRGEGFRERG
jgi:hypothetical protein